MEPQTRYLIEELCRFNNCSPGMLGSHFRKNRDANLKFIQDVGPLFLAHTLGHYPIVANNISKYSANQLYAFGFHKSRTTVEQYYLVKHNITLRFPHLPCIIMNGGFVVGQENIKHLFFPH